MLKKLAARLTSWKTKLVGRVTVGNAGVMRSCQPGDRDVPITAWSPVSNPLCQASWLLSGLTLTIHLRLEESYLRQWQISALWKTHGMTRRSREPVFRMYCGQRSGQSSTITCAQIHGPYCVLHRWRKCFRVQLDNKIDTVSIDRLRPFYEDEALRSASNETVNSSADDDVLPALISRSRRNLQPPHHLGYP